MLLLSVQMWLYRLWTHKWEVLRALLISTVMMMMRHGRLAPICSPVLHLLPHTHTHTPHSSLPVGEDWCRWVACWAQCLGVVQDNCVLLGASSGLHLLDSSMVSLAKQSMQQRVFTPTILLHLRYLLKVGWACRFVRPATITQSDTFTPGRCSTHTFCG